MLMFFCCRNRTDDVHFSAVLLTLDTRSGKTLSMERIFYPEFDGGRVA
jgi:hypothetical protein